MKPEFGNLEQIKVLQKEENDRHEKSEYENWYKDLSPGAKAFDAFVNIDWAMGAIQETTKKVTALFNGRSPIEIMIDKSTGYDKGVLKGFLIFLEGAYEHLIKQFKIIGDDEQEIKYKELLKKIKVELKTEYKKVKAVDL